MAFVVVLTLGDGWLVQREGTSLTHTTIETGPQCLPKEPVAAVLSA